MSGHFRVDGTGSGAAGVTLTGGGRIARADLFNGRLEDAEVSVAIDRGTLQASYDGRLQHVDPSVPFADPRFAASLTGTQSCAMCSGPVTTGASGATKAQKTTASSTRRVASM